MVQVNMDLQSEENSIVDKFRTKWKCNKREAIFRIIKKFNEVYKEGNGN